MISSSRNIRPLLGKLISGSATDPEINALVRCAFRFASQRLKQLLSSKRLHLHSLALSTDGIAFDCIAELFQRDEEGCFVELMDYFTGKRELELLDEEETTQQLRILVFSKLNQGLFRLYRENDPILARIIRNVKLAVKADRTYRQLELLGQAYIYSCPERERNDHLPEYQLEDMEREIMPGTDPLNRIPAKLRAIFDQLNHQDRYRRFCSIVDIALLIKRATARMESVSESYQHIEDGLLQAEIKEVLCESLETMKSRLHQKYVVAEKITVETFDRYWRALEKMTYNAFVLNDSSEISHPALLAEYFEGLDPKTYRLVHRTHFEYMARVVRNYVKDQLRELL